MSMVSLGKDCITSMQSPCSSVSILPYHLSDKYSRDIPLNKTACFCSANGLIIILYMRLYVQGLFIVFVIFHELHKTQDSLIPSNEILCRYFIFGNDQNRIFINQGHQMTIKKYQ